jgi:hypothetical protein
MFGRLKDWRRVTTRYGRCLTALRLRHRLAVINES